MGKYFKAVMAFDGEHPELLSMGVEGKLVKGRTLLFPQYWEGEPFSKPKPLPSFSLPFRLLVELAEQGGGMSKTGYGRVVTNRHGDKLVPYRWPKCYALQEHAYFCATELVAVDGWRDGVSIVSYRADIRDGVVVQVLEPIWAGEPHELPELFAQYANAVKAVMTKVYCYHCRHVHFATIRSQTS